MRGQSSSSSLSDSELALDAGVEADGVGVDTDGVVVDPVVVEILVIVEAVVAVDVPAIVVAGAEVATGVVVPTGTELTTAVVDDTTVVATAELDGVEMLPHDTAQKAPSLEIEVVLRFRQDNEVVVALASSTVQEPVHPAPLQYPILPVPPRQLTSIEA